MSSLLLLSLHIYGKNIAKVSPDTCFLWDNVKQVRESLLDFAFYCDSKLQGLIFTVVCCCKSSHLLVIWNEKEHLFISFVRVCTNTCVYRAPYSPAPLLNQLLLAMIQTGRVSVLYVGKGCFSSS